MATKLCKRCGETKPWTLEFFSKDTSRHNGLNVQCKACNVQRTKAWYDKPGNRERNRISSRAYCKSIKNPIRRSRTKTGQLTWAERDELKSMYAIRARVTHETGVEYHVDHMKALNTGGLHHPDNLQLLTALDNIRKSDGPAHTS